MKVWTRREGVEARQVGPELLIALEPEGTVHVLQPEAAAVWRACAQLVDGKVADLDALALETGLPVEQVEMALLELEAAELVRLATGLDRRQLLMRAGLVGGAAVVGSLVTSLRVPAMAAVTSGVVTPPATSAQVLLVHATQAVFAADVQSKLVGTGRFTTVDIFDAGDNTPTADTFTAYGAVLVWSDASFQDYAGLGDLLANYVDAGNRVVAGVFEHNNDTNLFLGGRWSDDGYDALSTGSQTSGEETLVAVMPADPLLLNVASFDGGSSSFRDGVTTTDGATLVASWSGDDLPLLAHKPSGSSGAVVVSLNFFPPSSDARDDFWDASTDGAAIMANALQAVFTPSA